MYNFKMDVDVNGNRIVRVSGDWFRGFSIQTNGKLLRTHRDGVGHWTCGEVRQYVLKFGTERQQDIIG